MDAALAIDLGASKFACGLVDDEGSVLMRRQVTVESSMDAEALFDQLRDVVGAVLRQAAAVDAPIAVCGLAAAGPITPGCESVSPLNLPGWRDFPLRARLAELTGLTVVGDLDTKALALGEGWAGAAVGVTDYLAMVVSTGVGGGIVLDGRLLEGGTGNAGHIGHVIVVPDGRVCACGAYGCLEAEASGPAIEAVTGRAAADANPAIIERTGRLVGRAVASVVNALDLGLTVVAGSVALGFGDPFFAAAQAELDLNCRLGGRRRPEIRPAGLGADASLVGAAAVGWRAVGRLALPGR